MTQEFAVVSFLKAARRSSPLLWWSSTFMVFGMLVCIGLQFGDARMIAGVNVWEKPAKFFLSLVVHALTVAWTISLIPQKTRGVKTATVIFVFAAWAEMAYMIFRASRGEASHFNVSDTLGAILYPLMGIGAVSLTLTSAFIGWRIWQQRSRDIIKLGAAMGLMLGAVLGLVAGAYLSSHTSHWIGGDMNDATGLPFFHWSTTGGDLRVAHFIGLHTTQAVPLAGLSGNRWVVYGLASLMVIAMVGAFAMALKGLPLFQM
jgi:hypothetical protein